MSHRPSTYMVKAANKAKCEWKDYKKTSASGTCQFTAVLSVMATLNLVMTLIRIMQASDVG
jgi:DNA-binding phage protein